MTDHPRHPPLRASMTIVGHRRLTMSGRKVVAVVAANVRGDALPKRRGR
jgi:hypothetical protein